MQQAARRAEERPEASCGVCGGSGLRVFFEVLQVPVLCNVLWPTREQALQCSKGDIQLAVCPSCGFIRNLAFEPTRVEYAQAYENSRYFSPQFRAYAETLARRLVEQYNLRGKVILEIGCGKGEFLEIICRLGGNRGIGIDPTYVTGRADTTAGQGITFIKDLYSERYAQYPFDLLCCLHSLEHIGAPTAFLTSIRRALGTRTSTVIFFEVPNVLYTIRDGGIWDIIYEHCSYFCAASMSRLFQLCGFKVSGTWETFEGQSLCLEGTPGDPGAISLSSKRAELDQLNRHVAVFGDGFQEKATKWSHFFEQMKSSGKRAVIWGAGSKGMTFLNVCKGSGCVEFAVDINPHKQGLHVPGTGQRVVPPEFLRDYRPNFILVMNPFYREEIARQTAAIGLDPEILTA